MTHTNNRLLDDLARLMTDAAGMARSARGEVDTFFRAQAERILGELDVVSREEFEAVKEMAAKARAEDPYDALQRAFRTIERSARERVERSHRTRLRSRISLRRFAPA